jgi:hypothetical protein
MGGAESFRQLERKDVRKMLIWLALAFNAAVFAVFYLWHKVTHRPQTLALSFIATFAIIMIAKGLVETEQVRAEEYWGGSVVKMTYYAPWTEKVHHSDPIMIPTVTIDAQGNATPSTTIGGYNEYDRNEVQPAHYDAVDSNGIALEINEDLYRRISARMPPASHQLLHHANEVEDGEAVEVQAWDGKDEHLYPITTRHDYVNRVQSSHEIRFPSVEANQVSRIGLVEHPAITEYSCPAILGADYPGREEAERQIQLLNAKLGKKKQLRVFVIVFKNKPNSAAKAQYDLWKGGNKNEFTVCVNVDNAGKVIWCKVISWTEAPGLKEDTERHVQGMGVLNLSSLTEKYLYPQLEQRFARKRFRDFNRLTLEPPVGVSLLANLFGILQPLALCFQKLKTMRG